MSGTELLIEIMSRFSETEPRAVVVVWTDDSDSVNMKTNSIGCTQAIGLMEYAKHNALRGIFRDPE